MTTQLSHTKSELLLSPPWSSLTQRNNNWKRSHLNCTVKTTVKFNHTCTQLCKPSETSHCHASTHFPRRLKRHTNTHQRLNMECNTLNSRELIISMKNVTSVFTPSHHGHQA